MTLTRAVWQSGEWSHAEGVGKAFGEAAEAAADRDEARAKLAVAVARIAELQSLLDAKVSAHLLSEKQSNHC
jgi:hypothetical protein